MIFSANRVKNTNFKRYRAKPVWIMKKWKAGPGHFEPDMKFFGSFVVQLPNTHSTEGDNSTFFLPKWSSAEEAEPNGRSYSIEKDNKGGSKLMLYSRQ